MVEGILYGIAVWALPVLVAITFHEAAHGWVAWKLGDATAYERGRVTFNPLRHVDPVGTVLLPAMLLLVRAPFLFGWAKPVPVNFNRLGNPRRDMILVALAGPGINLALALVSALLWRLAFDVPGGFGEWLARMLQASVIINVILAVFNMIPLPPLDGGRVAVGLLPAPLAAPLARLERVGFLLLIGLILVVPILGREVGLDLDVFALLVIEPARWIISTLYWLTGAV
jgi:Zn-dependent protease